MLHRVERKCSKTYVLCIDSLRCSYHLTLYVLTIENKLKTKSCKAFAGGQMGLCFPNIT